MMAKKNESKENPESSEEIKIQEVPVPEPEVPEESVDSVEPKYHSLLHNGYWFELGKKLMDDAAININTSAEKFEKLILWFWGVYTSIVGLGAGGFTVFAGKSISTATLIGLVLPSAVLLIAYWLTTSAGSSSVVRFEHRSPDSIREAYMEGIREKGTYYLLARIAAFIACLLIPFTIFLANRVESGDFEVIRVECNSDQSFKVHVYGKIPERQKYALRIKTADSERAIRGTTDTGHFYEEIIITPLDKVLSLELSWTESESKGKSVTKPVLLECGQSAPKQEEK